MQYLIQKKIVNYDELAACITNKFAQIPLATTAAPTSPKVFDTEELTNPPASLVIC